MEHRILGCVFLPCAGELICLDGWTAGQLEVKAKSTPSGFGVHGNIEIGENDHRMVIHVFACGYSDDSS